MTIFRKKLLILFLFITFPLQLFSAPAPQNSQFVSVDGNSPFFNRLTQLFEEVIEPLYGDQSSALQKIALSQDRTCELLIEKLKGEDKILGVLIYKNFPVEEFSSYGIHSALEIKTLFVVNPIENSGRGIGTKLIEQVSNHAKNNGPFENIVVTVSETKQDALGFFKHKGFKVTDTWADAYQKDTTELLLSKVVN